MLRVGIAGIGFMGMIHYLAYQNVSGAAVTAICSRSPRKRKGDWRGIQGNFGPPGTQMELGDVRGYAEISELLADPEIDLIDITLPPHRHADVALNALQFGKHVLCEKPLTLDAESAGQLVEASRAHNRQLLVGHVLPFFPEYQWARSVVDGGDYGKCLGGHFKRVIADPTWLENYWDPNLVGGPMLDLHVHDAHFIRSLFGMPLAVSTRGRLRGACAESWCSVFDYEDSDLVVSATSGIIGQQGRPFVHGFEIQLEQATLSFEFAVIGQASRYLCRPTLFGPNGETMCPELGDGNPLLAFERQLQEVVNGVRTGLPSEVLSGDLARDAITLCQRQTESLLRNETVSVE
jgi:predicted dehydrogenase